MLTIAWQVVTMMVLGNRDYGYAVETVVISTLLSIVTLPLIVGLAGLIF